MNEFCQAYSGERGVLVASSVYDLLDKLLDGSSTPLRSDDYAGVGKAAASRRAPRARLDRRALRRRHH